MNKCHCDYSVELQQTVSGKAPDVYFSWPEGMDRLLGNHHGY